MDPTGFMVVRLASGAVMLTLLTALRTRSRSGRGTWTMAVALAGYAVAFTAAYTEIAAGVGALLLFASVHFTMFVSGWRGGERPAPLGLGGTLLAAIGLLILTAPGVSAPGVRGSVLMVIAGISWGLYSLRGRASRDPLATTADNFVRATALTVPLVAVAVALRGLPMPTWTASGLVLAVCSGAVASGLAYAAWYAALPRLAAWRAALIQLAVPVVTAAAAVVWLGEVVTPRLLAALALVLGGLWIARR